MRLLVLLFVGYASLQIFTAVDVTIQVSWIVQLLFAVLALSGRKSAEIAFEITLWLRILGGAALYLHWGSVLAVIIPTVACATFAYGFWVLQERSRITFLIPLALPVAAVAVIRFTILPRWFSQDVLDARITADVTVPRGPLPTRWERYYSQGYSIGVPVGMKSALVGGDKGNAFTYGVRPPADDTLHMMACIFPRPTQFDSDPQVAAMAGQVLGATSEHDFARTLLDAGDGFALLHEKMSWLGLPLPERVEEIRLQDSRGFLFSNPQSNWYRARIYAPYLGKDHQIDLWFYGKDEPLGRDRVFLHLTTFRAEPTVNELLPDVDSIQTLMAASEDAKANILISSVLSNSMTNYEILYLLSVNLHRLAWGDKAEATVNRLRGLVADRLVSVEQMQAWRAKHAALEPPGYEALWSWGERVPVPSVTAGEAPVTPAGAVAATDPATSSSAE